MTLLLAVLLFGASPQSRAAMRPIAFLSMWQFGQSSNQHQPQKQPQGSFGSSGFGGLNSQSNSSFQTHWNSGNSGGLGSSGNTVHKSGLSFGSDNGCGNNFTDNGNANSYNDENKHCHHHHECDDDNPSPENPTWILGLLGFAGLYFTRKKLR